MCGAVEWDVYDENATHYVFTPITTARQGNRMFCLATAIVMALKQRLPLFVPLRYVLAMHADGFPCVRSSRGLDVKIRGSFTARVHHLILIWNFADSGALSYGEEGY